MVETELLRALEEVRVLAHDAGTSGCSNNWMLRALSSFGTLNLPGQIADADSRKAVRDYLWLCSLPLTRQAAWEPLEGAWGKKKPAS